MKRVVAFFDMFDVIPDSAKYLYSNKFEFAPTEVHEEKMCKMISNIPSELQNDKKAVVFLHYYEVDTNKFEELNETTNFLKKTNAERIKEFMEQYKIPIK